MAALVKYVTYIAFEIQECHYDTNIEKIFPIQIWELFYL